MRENEFKQIKHSGHGGSRAGSGRPRNAVRRTSCDHCQDPRSAALALAVRGSDTYRFVLAMFALGAPIDDIRRALGGMSKAQFISLYVAGGARGENVNRL